MTYPCKIDPLVTVGDYLDGKATKESVAEVIKIRVWTYGHSIGGLVPRPLWWLPRAGGSVR